MNFDAYDNEYSNEYSNSDNNFNSSLGMGLVMLNERQTSNHNSNIEHSNTISYCMYELHQQINDMFFRDTDWISET